MSPRESGGVTLETLTAEAAERLALAMASLAITPGHPDGTPTAIELLSRET